MKKPTYLLSVCGYITHKSFKIFFNSLDASAKCTSFSPPPVEVIARSPTRFTKLGQGEVRPVSVLAQMYNHLAIVKI